MSASEGSSTPVEFIQHGLSLMSQFENSGTLAHLDGAIAYQKQAIGLTAEGDAARSWALSCLGEAFMRRFNHYGNPEDIIKATENSTRAVDTAPEMLVAPFLGILGKIYLCRFSAFHQLEDIERSLSSLAQALRHTSPEAIHLPETYSELGLALQCRFEQLKRLKDIDHAVMCHEQSLIFRARLPEALPKWLGCLGTALRDRFEYLDQEEDINRSLTYFRWAAELMPDTRAGDKAAYLNNFGTALACRFDHRGRLADLDESIQIFEKALSLTPDGHSKKSGYLNNLGYCLQKRFHRLDEMNDIDQAISYQKESISLSSMSLASYPGLYSNLGNSLLYRFYRTNDPTDLDEAVCQMKKAVEISGPNDVLRSRWLNNLGNSLELRFKVEGKPEDIDTSIDYLIEAILATHDNDSHRATWLANLGTSFMARFQRFEQIDDLENAIKHRTHASSLIPEGHVFKCEILNLLGECHVHRSLHLHTPQDLIMGIWAFREAALLPSGLPHQRFLAALHCARYSLPMDGAFALRQYQIAINLLPRIVWLGTTVQRRYERIPSIGSAVTEAAARAVESQQYELALEWLEQGRSIVWQQILNLRTPFDDLSRVDFNLANRLEAIALQLDHKGTPNNMISDYQSNPSHPEQEAQTHRRLAEEWDQILDEVRQIPGFDRFLLPRKASELFKTARSGAVVAINIHNIRCDALVLCPNSQDVTHVPLPEFSHEKAIAAYGQLMRSLRRKNIRERGFKQRQTQHGDEFKSMLSLLWSDIIQPILECLGHMQIAPADDLPHITWCTTGSLAFLPLHAAGCYSKPHERVYNYVISSYTPTISAILGSGRGTGEFYGILAIGQASTPGLSPLPQTTQELNRIEKLAGSLRYTQLKGSEATTSVVLDGIQKHSWVHLACHASQNSSDPTASAFHLHDGPLSLATITQQSFKHTELAFLSACQTAKGDPDLPEEAVHLAAGMLIAGFPAVIATMWSIRDEDAPLIAEEVYAKLLEGEIPDSGRAAKALHMAVKGLREKVGEKEFTSWVPYVHLGI
ncbi:hypothetical protein BDV93DRAFT_522431 [Ceratobasidium sp. AG-I]|nr:hypothetical protein BDV93DRAFT_522431 [Ceratobasidium sp. AG-I]